MGGFAQDARPTNMKHAHARSFLVAAVLALAACGTDEARKGSIAIPIDATVAPAQPAIAGRPLGRMVSESGVATDFFLGELLVATDDRAKLDAFVARWGATAVESTPPVGSMPAIHKVKLDPSSAVVEQLLSELNAKAPDLRGTFRTSSDAAAKLLAVALAEANAGGMTVMPNFVLVPHGIAEGTTNEAPTGDRDHYRTNAFEWPYMNRGSAQDTGVAAAWQVMARAGVFRNKVKMMILDGGFAPNADFPASRAVVGDWNVPNPSKCSGGGDCPWHGTWVTSAAMGTVDDGHGAAGPAAPVAELVAVPFELEFFALLSTIERVFVGAAAADIINVSSGFEIDIGWDVAVKIACLGTCPSPTEVAGGVMATVAGSNKLIFASAGNAARDVDGASTPEGSTIVPCELPGVICVGGMEHDATALAFSGEGAGSNFGTKTDDDSVDIYGPYRVWVGSDPDHPADGAQFVPGTSFSSPFVAGVAALVWASDPRQSAAQVWQVMRETAHVGGVHPGGGHQRRINALGAVGRVLGGARPTVTLDALATSAPMNREWSVTAVVNDDGALCAPARCPLTWNPAPARVVGNTAFYRFDTAGPKTISVTTEDPAGQPASASRTVDVTNAPPVVSISAPAAGATVPKGVMMQLLGAATDANEGPDPGPGTLACHWTSSNPSDVFPITGCDVVRAFYTEGSRTLTLSATDAQGQTSSATVTLTVTAPPVNYPPTVSSTTTLPPVNYDGKGYLWTTALPLSASVSDPEGDYPVTWEWKATSFRPNSATPYATAVTIGSSSSFAWTPSSTPSLFGDFAAFGNDCYAGQIVRITVRATDSLGNTSAPVNLPDLRVYRCTLD